MNSYLNEEIYWIFTKDIGEIWWFFNWNLDWPQQNMIHWYICILICILICITKKQFKRIHLVAFSIYFVIECHDRLGRAAWVPLSTILFFWKRRRRRRRRRRSLWCRWWMVLWGRPSSSRRFMLIAIYVTWQVNSQQTPVLNNYATPIRFSSLWWHSIASNYIYIIYIS